MTKQDFHKNTQDLSDQKIKKIIRYGLEFGTKHMANMADSFGKEAPPELEKFYKNSGTRLRILNKGISWAAIGNDFQEYQKAAERARRASPGSEATMNVVADFIVQSNPVSSRVFAASELASSLQKDLTPKLNIERQRLLDESYHALHSDDPEAFERALEGLDGISMFSLALDVASAPHETKTKVADYLADNLDNVIYAGQQAIPVYLKNYAERKAAKLNPSNIEQPQDNLQSDAVKKEMSTSIKAAMSQYIQAGLNNTPNEAQKIVFTKQERKLLTQEIVEEIKQYDLEKTYGTKNPIKIQAIIDKKQQLETIRDFSTGLSNSAMILDALGHNKEARALSGLASAGFALNSALSAGLTTFAGFTGFLTVPIILGSILANQSDGTGEALEEIAGLISTVYENLSTQFRSLAHHIDSRIDELSINMREEFRQLGIQEDSHHAELMDALLNQSRMIIHLLAEFKYDAQTIQTQLAQINEGIKTLSEQQKQLRVTVQKEFSDIHLNFYRWLESSELSDVSKSLKKVKNNFRNKVLSEEKYEEQLNELLSLIQSDVTRATGKELKLSENDFSTTIALFDADYLHPLFAHARHINWLKTFYADAAKRYLNQDEKAKALANKDLPNLLLLRSMFRVFLSGAEKLRGDHVKKQFFQGKGELDKVFELLDEFEKGTDEIQGFIIELRSGELPKLAQALKEQIKTLEQREQVLELLEKTLALMHLASLAGYVIPEEPPIDDRTLLTQFTEQFLNPLSENQFALDNSYLYWAPINTLYPHLHRYRNIFRYPDKAQGIYAEWVQQALPMENQFFEIDQSGRSSAVAAQEEEASNSFWSNPREVIRRFEELIPGLPNLGAEAAMVVEPVNYFVYDGFAFTPTFEELPQASSAKPEKSAGENVFFEIQNPLTRQNLDGQIALAGLAIHYLGKAYSWVKSRFSSEIVSPEDISQWIDKARKHIQELQVEHHELLAANYDIEKLEWLKEDIDQIYKDIEVFSSCDRVYQELFTVTDNHLQETLAFTASCKNNLQSASRQCPMIKPGFFAPQKQCLSLGISQAKLGLKQ